MFTTRKHACSSAKPLGVNIKIYVHLFDIAVFGGGLSECEPMNG